MRPSRAWGRRLLIGAGSAALLLLLAASVPGPDFGRYLDWSRALGSGEIDRLAGGTTAPTGLPMTQWSHGPGGYFAVVQWLLPEVLDPARAAFVAGWLAAVAFWGLVAGALHRVGGGSLPVTVLGVTLLAVGTHAGFYTRAHASESLSYGLLGILAWQAIRRRPSTVSDALATGAAAAGLLLLRSYYVVYALPATLRCHDAFRGAGRWRSLGAYVAPLGLALGQVLLVNRWMTGRLLGSPYSFGDGGFHSFDWTDPELLAVIAHPWHGLLSYHPFYAIGLAVLVYELARARGRGERWLLASALVAVLVNLYIQAAWYAWWLGTGTFGMRGMAPAAVPLVLATAWHLRRDGAVGGWTRAALLAALSAASLWSALLLRLGHTQFFTWGELVAGLRRSATTAAAPGTLIWLAVGAGVTALGLLLAGGWRSEPRVSITASALAGLTVAWLAPAAAGRPLGQVGTLLFGAATTVLAVALVGLAVQALRDLWRPAGAELAVPGWPRLIGWGAALSLIAVSFLFARLAYRTEGRLEAPPAAAGAVFHEREVVATYREYAAVEGFEEDKEALAGFLRRRGLIEP